MPKTLYVVSSVATQRDVASRAEELYASHWFDISKAYIAHFSQDQDSWLILSAKHGLLEPWRDVQPYDESKLSQSRLKRQGRNRALVADLLRRTEPGDTIVLLVGKRQRENLVQPLHEAERTVEIPMADLRINQQKAWMKKKLEEAGAPLPDERKGIHPRHPPMLDSSALITEASRVGGGSP